MQQTIIKPLAKGQITIPASFRKKLNIQEDTLFRAEVKENGILLTPLRLGWEEKYIREFSDEEMTLWLKGDKVDKATLKKLQQLLT